MTTSNHPVVQQAGGQRLWMVKLQFDTRQRQARKDLATMREMHRTVMRLAPNNLGESPRAAAGLLFRLEPDRRSVLAQLSTSPRTAELGDYLTAKTVEMTRIFDRIQPGIRVRFRCTATPVKRKGSKETAILDRHDLTEWWNRKASAAGLIGPGPSTIETDLVKVDKARKLHLTRFDGEAKVEDPNKLAAAIKQGVGRNKNWGAGLLTLAPGRR